MGGFFSGFGPSCVSFHFFGFRIRSTRVDTKQEPPLSFGQSVAHLAASPSGEKMLQSRRSKRAKIISLVRNGDNSCTQVRPQPCWSDASARQWPNRSWRQVDVAHNHPKKKRVKRYKPQIFRLNSSDCSFSPLLCFEAFQSRIIFVNISN